MGFKIKSTKPKLDPSVSINGIDVNVFEIKDQSITLEEYINKEFRANTPGFNELIKKYDNETLLYKLNKHILPNCSQRNDITYDGALQMNYVPELIARIQELETRLNTK